MAIFHLFTLVQLRLSRACSFQTRQMRNLANLSDIYERFVHHSRGGRTGRTMIAAAGHGQVHWSRCVSRSKRAARRHAVGTCIHTMPRSFGVYTMLVSGEREREEGEKNNRKKGRKERLELALTPRTRPWRESKRRHALHPSCWMSMLRALLGIRRRKIDDPQTWPDPITKLSSRRRSFTFFSTGQKTFAREEQTEFLELLFVYLFFFFFVKPTLSI